MLYNINTIKDHNVTLHALIDGINTVLLNANDATVLHYNYILQLGKRPIPGEVWQEGSFNWPVVEDYIKRKTQHLFWIDVEPDRVRLMSHIGQAQLKQNTTATTGSASRRVGRPPNWEVGWSVVLTHRGIETMWIVTVINDWGITLMATSGRMRALSWGTILKMHRDKKLQPIPCKRACGEDVATENSAEDHPVE